MNEKPRSVLITGATGYIGSHVTKRFIAEGWDVHIIIRPNSQLNLLKTIIDSLIVHIHDGSTEKMIKIVQASSPTIVVHLASFATITYQSRDLSSMLQSNIIFGTQLVEAMIANKVFYLVNTGTYSQHYNDAEYNPQSLYAATKQAFEDILLFYSESTPLKVLTLTLFDTYGHLDPRSKIIPQLVKTFHEKIPLSLSPGEQLIDLVFINDIVDAYMIAVDLLLEETETKMEKFAVTSQRPIQLRELVSIFEKVVDCKLPINWGGLPYRNREIMFPWTKGIPLTGWTPKVSIEEGIRRLLDTEGDSG